ncbi:MAG: LytTR family DNA-binding domain-containing protein [bacterium]|nr:LytTR family DNA-binding domain-containing protein [bacterium]
MINICLCDDDAFFLETCTRIIQQIGKETQLDLSVQTFINGESLLFELEDKVNTFDIIIMDMIMKEINGIGTAKQLRDFGFNGEIIFLSSSKEYAIDSFEVEPLNYILKDFHYQTKLQEVLKKAINQIEKKNAKKLIIYTKKKRIVMELSEITYIECVNKTLFLYKEDGGVEEYTSTLGSIEEKIREHGFIRCHKSYIVNAAYIETYTKAECKLRGDYSIPIGRKYANLFKEELMQYEFDHIVI